jgi:hypothetical protein
MPTPLRNIVSPNDFIQRVNDEASISEVVISSGTRTWSRKFSSDETRRHELVHELFSEVIAYVKSDVESMLVRNDVKIGGQNLPPCNSYHILPCKDHNLKVSMTVHADAFNNHRDVLINGDYCIGRKKI